jgi:hypothetical protein
MIDHAGRARPMLRDKDSAMSRRARDAMLQMGKIDIAALQGACDGQAV